MVVITDTRGAEITSILSPSRFSVNMFLDFVVDILL